MIYLDHAATTPVDPEVTQAMIPYLAERFGNPSSIHAPGQETRAAMDSAREAIALALSCDFSEVYFTSSGTEANNMAVIGAMWAAPSDRKRLIVSSIEHPSVMKSAQFLESTGYVVTRLPVDSVGRVEPAVLEDSITDETALVSVVHGNNEIGTVQDIARLARIAHDHGALFHTDSVQTFGSLPIHVGGMGCDLLSISAHKIYGPKGAGALYARSAVKVSPIIHGGSQERERRAGTENTAAIVGFGKATELAMTRRGADSHRLSELRDWFIERLLESIPGTHLNGPREGRLPNNVNISIEGVDGASVLMNLDRAGIAASSGSACSSGSIEPSPVLSAIGLPPELASSGIRFTLGRSNSATELNQTTDALHDIVHRIRQ